MSFNIISTTKIVSIELHKRGQKEKKNFLFRNDVSRILVQQTCFYNRKVKCIDEKYIFLQELRYIFFTTLPKQKQDFLNYFRSTEKS